MRRIWSIALISLGVVACGGDGSNGAEPGTSVIVPATGGTAEPTRATTVSSGGTPSTGTPAANSGGVAGGTTLLSNAGGGVGGTTSTSPASTETGGATNTGATTTVPDATGGTTNCGSGKTDCAGACDGPAIELGAACCASGKTDCAGVCDGPAIKLGAACCASGKTDCAGVCDGPAIKLGAACCASGKTDCAGVCDGPAIKLGAACCASGKTDCSGVCDGPAIKLGATCCASGKTDCAGVCDGPAIKLGAACCASGKTDCAGVCDGPAIINNQRCCPTGACPAPLCDDGYLNGTETAVDCGGNCPLACKIGSKCSAHSDCDGIGNCVGGTCVRMPKGLSLDFGNGHIEDIVRDPINGSVYVSVAPVNLVTQPIGGKVLAFAPGATTPAWSVPISDGNPSALAISDDGRTLYIAITFGKVGIAAMDITTRALGPTFSLGTDNAGVEAYAIDLAVVPGDATTVAAALGSFSSTENAGVHFYREGVEVYPGATLDQWQRNSALSWTDVTALAFKDANTLYVYNGDTSEFGLGTVQLQTAGPYLEKVSPLVLLGFDRDIVYSNGKLFASSTQVVDPERHNVLGTFPAMGGMAVAPNGSRAYFIRGDHSDLTAVHFYVDCFDPETFLLTGSIPIDSTVEIPLSLTWGKFSVWGDTGLAIQFSDMSSHDNLVLLPDVLSRVNGCLPKVTPAIVRSTISTPDASVDGVDLYVLDARWLTADPSTGSLYVSVGSGDPRYPNSLVRFPNSGNGEVDLAVAVGSEPGPLAVTEDGSRAWVALNGAAVVVPVDTDSGVVSAPIQLAYDSRHGEMYAQDIEAFPGLFDSFVVTGKSIYSTIRLGMHVYDSDASRFPWTHFPMTAIAHTDAMTFEFVGPNRIISVNGVEQVLLEVGSTGFTAITHVDSYARQIQVGAGLALDDRGKVASTADLATIETLSFIGRGTALSTMEYRHFKVSTRGHRFYDVGDYLGGVVIECIDAVTRISSGLIPIPIDSSLVYELEFFGDHGLALRAPGVLAIVPDALTLAGCEP